MSMIVLIGGGTGGHLFSALSLMDELKRRGYSTRLVTDYRCKKYINNHLGNEEISFINSSPIGKGFVGKFLSFIKIFFALISSSILLLRVKPDLVIGFGGYPSFPVLAIAKIFNISIIVHEQNSFLGKVNCYFAQYAKVVAVSFLETANIPSREKNKIVVTGNPIRSDIKNLKVNRNFDDKFLRILVVGGSQGARFFAKLVPSAIKLAKIKEPNLQIQIIQQANKEEALYLKKLYTSLSINHEISDFFFDIGDKYSKSHVIICRAGASTIAEIVAVGLPAIFIPLPTASYDHQLINAKFFAKKNMGWVFEQKTVKPEQIADKIIELFNFRNILKNISKKLLDINSSNAEAMLADVVIGAMKNS